MHDSTNHSRRRPFRTGLRCQVTAHANIPDYTNTRSSGKYATTSPVLPQLLSPPSAYVKFPPAELRLLLSIVETPHCRLYKQSLVFPMYQNNLCMSAIPSSICKRVFPDSAISKKFLFPFRVFLCNIRPQNNQGHPPLGSIPLLAFGPGQTNFLDSMFN